MKRENHHLNSDGEQSKIFLKRRKTNKVPHEYHQDVNLKNSYDLAIGRMNSKLLADYTARQTRKFRSDLSILELQDLIIPGRKCDRFPTSRGCFEACQLNFKNMLSWTQANGPD